MKPKISIVITCYNLGTFLQEAMDSIAQYPHPEHYEVVIVDDGSTEPYTLQLLNSLDTSKWRLIRQVNQGLGKARNNGIRAAKGEYIIPLDADNRLRPSLIAHTIQILDADPPIDIVFGDAEYFGERTGRWTVGAFDFKLLLERNRIDACAGFRRTMWERLGGYDEQMPAMGYEDWDLWLRASVAGAGFHYVPEVLFDYRVRTGSMLTGTMQKRDLIVEYMFNKPQLRFLKDLRTSYLKLLDRERNPEVLTGRDHFRLLTGRVMARIGIGKSTT